MKSRQERTLHDIASNLNTLTKTFTPILSRLDKIEQQLQNQNREHERTTPSDKLPTTTPTPIEESDGSDYESARKRTPSKLPATTSILQSGTGQFLPLDACQTVRATRKCAHRVFETEITLPADHTTAVHTMLLDWSTMRQFVKNIIPNGMNYPRELEENRGTLKLYGRGEGVDLFDGAHGSIPTFDTGNDVGCAAASHESNNWRIGLTAPTTGADYHRSVLQHNWGGLNIDGTIKLDARTVRRLHQSYLSHIHLLQPFLDKKVLASMVERFIQLYSPNVNERGGISPYAVPETYPSRRFSKKRKLSESSPVSRSGVGVIPSPGNQIDRSIGNAIVLLVLALGRICEHKMYLPVPLGGPNTIVDNALQMSSTDSPHETVESPASSHSTLVSIPSPEINGSCPMNRRPSPQRFLTGREEAAGRNMDTTPGLAYYTYAVEILGTVHGGNDLSHGQAGVLACLYMGQLARVLESWNWICYACRVCGVLIDKYGTSNVSRSHAD